ncbi:hypothetical protein A2U01_0002868 [Trifolium medium]|uniref:Uncharacterized protein n=1 Tax=Trifolium medium TaxID=97028 RepID=A0A392M3V2_9FABA|nr:hypothetical protein [Trifolium medium]
MNCKYQSPPKITASSTTVNKPKVRPIVKPIVLNVEKPLEGDVMNLENEVLCEGLHDANVIHDMHVLVLLSAPTTAQQAMNFTSDFWANMAQNEEIVDSVGNTNQQFQLVVPKNKGRTSSSTNNLRLANGLR